MAVPRPTSTPFDLEANLAKQEKTRQLAEELRKKAKLQQKGAKTGTAKPRPARDLSPSDKNDLRNKFLEKAEGKTPRPAADLNPSDKSDLRNKFLEKSEARTPRPAADLDPGNKSDLRNKFLRDAERGASKGAATEAGAAGRAATRSIGSRVVGFAGRVAGPVGALVGMTEPAGEEEVKFIRDKSSRGPLMKGNSPDKMSAKDVAEAYRRRKASESNVSKYPGRGTGPTRRVLGQGPNLPRVVDGGTTENWSGPGNYASAVKRKAAPVPKMKPSTANQGYKANKPTKMIKQGDAKPVAKRKPITSFEGMKMRQYEKEGTVFDPRSKVLKERKYKISDLFKKKR